MQTEDLNPAHHPWLRGSNTDDKNISIADLKGLFESMISESTSPLNGNEVATALFTKASELAQNKGYPGQAAANSSGSIQVENGVLLNLINALKHGRIGEEGDFDDILEQLAEAGQTFEKNHICWLRRHFTEDGDENGVPNLVSYGLTEQHGGINTPMDNIGYVLHKLDELGQRMTVSDWALTYKTSVWTNYHSDKPTPIYLTLMDAAGRAEVLDQVFNPELYQDNPAEIKQLYKLVKEEYRNQINIKEITQETKKLHGKAREQHPQLPSQ